MRLYERCQRCSGYPDIVLAISTQLGRFLAVVFIRTSWSVYHVVFFSFSLAKMVDTFVNAASSFFWHLYTRLLRIFFSGGDGQ